MGKGDMIICQRCRNETVKRSNGQQKYCFKCSLIAEKLRKKKWREKNEKPKEKRVCCICGKEEYVWQLNKGDYYCEKHYHEMYHFGEIKNLDGKRKENNFVAKGSATEIHFPDGNTAFIDTNDLEKVNKHYWSINSDGYLHSRVQGKIQRMHRLILDFPNGIVDHINRNRLDNRKKNLRLTNDLGNVRNSSISKNNTSGVAGVTKIKDSRKWKAQITVNYRDINLGHFDDFRDAVTARRLAEVEYFGEYAPNWND